MKENRIKPPGVNTPLPPNPQTPLPPDEYVYPGDAFKPTIPVAPANVWPHLFTEIAEMAEHIARDPENRNLHPPECTDPNCPYSRTPIMQQRYALMRRLYQLNAQLGGDSELSGDESDNMSG